MAAENSINIVKIRLEDEALYLQLLDGYLNISDVLNYYPDAKGLKYMKNGKIVKIPFNNNN